MKNFLSKRELLYLTGGFIAWRMILFVVVYFAPNFIPTFGNTFPYVNMLQESNLPKWVWVFGNFDGVHYLRIAKDGYAYQYTQAFFPIYPLLIRLLSLISKLNLLVSALLISNLCFYFAYLLFFKLVKKTENQKTAIWSSIFLLTFPTSYFFGAIYTEGLFFFLIISSFYLFEEGKIFQSLILGSVASATRLVGVFITLALMRKKRWILPIFIVPLGLLLYMLYLAARFHNPFYFYTSQQVFGQGRSAGIVLLPQVFVRYFKIFLTTHGTILFFAFLEFFWTVFAVAMLALSIKKINISWVIFSFLAIITPTLTGTLTSMPRYVLIAFPIYIALAQIKNLYLKLAIATGFSGLLILNLIHFAQGYWVA